MTELHLYIAEDGTEFEDEEECLRYETGYQAKELKGKVVLMDAQFKPIPLDNLGDWDKTFFIFVKDVPALHELRAVWDWDLTGMCIPDCLMGDTAGLFAYDDDADAWYHMGTRLQGLQAIADKAMSVINKNV